MTESSVQVEPTRLTLRVWGVVVALCLIQFVDVMGVTVIVTTLPKMLSDVGATAADGTLVATAYAMFFGGLLMFGARIGDRVGHRRCILASLAVFAVGALLAATATSTLALTAARCVQGGAAAGAVPSALKLLTSVTGNGPGRARALAVWSAAGAAAGAAGYVAGGIVTNAGSWRYIFWGLLVLSAAQAAAVLALVPRSRPIGVGQPLNLAGSVLFTVSIMLVVIGTSFLGEPPHRNVALLVLGTSVLALGLFVAADHRSPTPLLPRAVLRLSRVLRGTAGAFVNTATTSGAATLLTFYLQGTLGRSPLAAAATLLPMSVAVIAGSAPAARLIVRHSRERVAAVGLGLIGVGIAMLLLSPSSAVLVGVSVAIAGFGLGLSSVATTSMVTDVAEKQRATASGMVNTGAQLGTAIGTAAVLLVATAATGVPGSSDRVPYLAWGVAAAAAGLIAVVFGRMHGRPVR